MSDAELAIEAEKVTLAELETAVATMKRQGALAERILRRRQTEGPNIVYLEVTRVRAVLAVG